MQKFTMTQAQHDKLMDACKPVPYLIIGGVAPRSQQENANDAWQALGKEMGFRHMTVKPGDGKYVFYAEPVSKEGEQ
jgi:hypothetical protein